MRSIRSPYPTPDQQPQDEQPSTTAEEQLDSETAEQVAPVLPLRGDQPQFPAKPEASPLDQLLTFVQGPLLDWIARERPTYMASPVTFVRERWSPSWIPSDAGVVLWGCRVLLLVRALAYTVFYLPAMTIYLPELTTAALVAYLILHFFA